MVDVPLEEEISSALQEEGMRRLESEWGRNQ